MMIRPQSVEDSLKGEVGRWLSRALAGVLALRSLTFARGSDYEQVVQGVAETRDAIDAVRLYASMYAEVAITQHSPMFSLRFTELATQMCCHLEEEVIFAEDKLLSYAG